MEQVKILSAEQEFILKLFQGDPFLRKNFYFTGGTVLSEFYLKHRFSEDLDFFSEKPFAQQILLNIISGWSKKHKFTVNLRTVEDVTYIFNFTFANKKNVKVDFAYYPYKRIEKGKIVNMITIDSCKDIAVNKFSTIIQRTEAKDFVDLYFLLKEYSLWDLLRGAEIKFRYEIDPLLLASDFTKVEEFDFLPKMLTPLTLPCLKQFFLDKAKEVASRAVET